MIIQKHKAEKVLFDIALHRRSELITTNTIYFDSKSECKCYLMLCKYFNQYDWNIGIHQKLITPSCDWKIDFCVTPKLDDSSRWNQLTRIAAMINPGYYSHDIPKLWIEFKGYQDKNFLDKMGLIKCNHPEIAKKIILVSGVDAAFGVYDNIKQKSHTHFIISMYNLESILKDVIR